MKAFCEFYNGDMARYGNSCPSYLKKFHRYFRKAQCCPNKLIGLYYRYRLSRIREKNGIEISAQNKIGKGLYIGHPYCITLNPEVVMGENCNIHKGVTIGKENRGSRKGTPTIGNRVWIGINATIVGNITIGDDVLIAPNSFVNCDVPSHCVVFGNPCVIKQKESATEGYINHTV